MNSNHTGMYNCSSEFEITIKDLAQMVSNILGFTGNIIYNTNKPEGHARKGFTCAKLKNTGWTAKTDIQTGIQLAYDWYKQNIK